MEYTVQKIWENTKLTVHVHGGMFDYIHRTSSQIRYDT